MGLLARRKEYFRTCETFQSLIWITWMKQVMKINPVAVTETYRGWATDFCIPFHPLCPKVNPWFNAYTWALLRKNLGQLNKLDRELQKAVVMKWVWAVQWTSLVWSYESRSWPEQSQQRMVCPEQYSRSSHCMIFLLRGWVDEGRGLLTGILFSALTTSVDKIYIIIV